MYRGYREPDCKGVPSRAGGWPWCSQWGGGQGCSGNIDLIPLLCALFGADRPSFDRGDVTIGRGRLFQSDDGLRQFAVVVMLVELPEHLFELACGAAGLNGAFHGERPFS